MRSGGPDAPVDEQLLDWLCELYNAAAAVNPRFDAVPCLACAGWSAGEQQAALGQRLTHGRVASGKSPEATLTQTHQLIYAKHTFLTAGVATVWCARI